MGIARLWRWRRRGDRGAFAKFMQEWAFAIEAQKPAPIYEMAVNGVSLPSEALEAVASGVVSPEPYQSLSGHSDATVTYPTGAGQWSDAHLRAHGLKER